MSVIKTNPGFVLLNADPIVWVNFNCSAKPKDYGHKAEFKQHNLLVTGVWCTKIIKINTKPSSSSAGVENL